jgi:lipoprotein Spr
VRFSILLITLLFTVKANAKQGAPVPDSLANANPIGCASNEDSLFCLNAADSVCFGTDLALLDFYRSKGVALDPVCSQIELYREVYSWLGVRYRYAGLTKKGVDCAGFVRNICNSIYGTNLSGSAGHHFKQCVPIDRSELEEGDLVFFKIRKSYISHVGIYLGNGKFAHAAVHGGVTISSLSEAYYNKYYYLSGRLVNTPNKKRW